MKSFIVTIIILMLVGVGFYFLPKTPFLQVNELDVSTATSSAMNADTNDGLPNILPTQESTLIGKSVQNRDINAYHFGYGDKELLFIGGIHGGYSWNTVLVAYELIDYLKDNPDVIPSNLKVTVIPVLNPDGLDKVVGTTTSRFKQSDVSKSQAVRIAGRFNAHGVDLSRNFDCRWRATGLWQAAHVSGGSQVFSEPESSAIKNYVENNKPAAVVVWYSAAGGVYSSSCDGGVMDETKNITNLYAQASDYPAYDNFDFYETSGDMVSWLAKIKVPAISVLLTSHDDVEWDKNRKGIEALLQHYRQ